MKRLGIRSQITALTLIPLLVIVISLETFFLQARFSDLDRDLIEHGKLTAHQLSVSAEYGLFSNNMTFLESIADNAMMQNSVRSIAILDSNNSIVLHATQPDDNLGLSGLEKLVRNAQSGMLNPILIEAGSIWIYQPIKSVQVSLDDMDGYKNPQQVGGIIVEMTRKETEHKKREMLWFTIMVTGLILIFPFYAIFLASRNITKPIRVLSNAIQKIAQGDFTARVNIRNNETQEFIYLSNGINEMVLQIQSDREVLEQRIEEATQALRIKKEEAERTSHNKSHFLAVASHDLRQPLHALGLYIAALQRKVSGEEGLHLVGQIERSVESLSTLLNALLDISKLDAGAIAPQIEIFDVNTMLSHVAADYDMLAKIRNIRLVVHGNAAYIRSDPILLERILVNLVSNAIRYTPQNGCVMIACRRRDGRLRIEVRDNGIGINSGDQANIFREFYQLAQPQLDSSKGLGLGLAIVDRLVKLLGHRIDLHSSPSKGTTFSVEVPIVASGEISQFPSVLASVPVDSVATTPLTGKKVLIIDDDEIVLKSTASILEIWGCATTSATSLSEVEQQLEAGLSWDVIISDYQLGNSTTGLDAISLIQNYQGKDTPCILISGFTGPKLLQLAAVSGHYLLHKPVKPAKLRSLLSHLLEKAK